MKWPWVLSRLFETNCERAKAFSCVSRIWSASIREQVACPSKTRQRASTDAAVATGALVVGDEATVRKFVKGGRQRRHVRLPSRIRAIVTPTFSWRCTTLPRTRTVAQRSATNASGWVVVADPYETSLLLNAALRDLHAAAQHAAAGERHVNAGKLPLHGST